MVDARLADGSRVNAIIPPLALDGPALSIRRFGTSRLAAEDLLANEAMTREMLEIPAGGVRAGINMLISGGTGAGKTTLLNVLSALHPATTSASSPSKTPPNCSCSSEHVVRLETRPANIEGMGEVHQRELVMQRLRMRPDRIIIGEVSRRRGPRHAPGHEHRPRRSHDHHPRQHTRDALTRLEKMVGMAGFDLPDRPSASRSPRRSTWSCRWRA